MVQLLVYVFLFLSILVPQTISESCSNLPGGLNVMTRGVDVTSLDLTPIKLEFSRTGFKRLLFEWSCNQSKEWTNADNDRTYSQPDDIDLIQNVPSGTRNTDVELIKFWNDVKQSLAANVGVEVGIRFKFINIGAFSGSASYKSMTNTVSSYDKRISTSAVAVCAFEAFQSRDIRLSPSVVAELNDLPSSFEDSPEQYQKFIDDYGTHFFTKGKFGGVIRLYTETSSLYYLRHTDRELTTQTKSRLSFVLVSLFNADVEGSQTTTDEDFVEQSSESITYYGGNTNLLTAGEFENWQPTVSTNPALVGGKLEPISNLIEDTERQRSMELAATAYIDRGVLDELRTILDEKLQDYRKSGRDVGKIEQLDIELRSQQSKVVPDHDKVIALFEQIQFNFLIPSWWTEIELCYMENTDRNGYNCPLRTSQTCESTEHFTSEHREVETPNEEACVSAWGIFWMSEPDDWFKSLRLVIMHQGNCNVDNDHPFASINVYAKAQVSYISKRDDDCRLSWKLEAPSELDIPEWSKDILFCFSAVNIQNTFCANLNEWTPDYKTQLKEAKFELQWGLFTSQGHLDIAAADRLSQTYGDVPAGSPTSWTGGYVPAGSPTSWTGAYVPAGSPTSGTHFDIPADSNTSFSCGLKASIIQLLITFLNNVL